MRSMSAARGPVNLLVESKLEIVGGDELIEFAWPEQRDSAVALGTVLDATHEMLDDQGFG